jgi:hypothetical protein
MRPSNVTVLARLKSGPIFVWVGGSLLLSLLVIFKEKSTHRGLYFNVFGDYTVLIVLLCFAVGTASFVQMYRWRHAYLSHDSNTLYRGWRDKWSITGLSDAYIATNWLGIRSLRAQIGSRDVELFKAYFVIEDVEAVLEKLQALRKSS